jgi:hypothetical protein
MLILQETTVIRKYRSTVKAKAAALELTEFFNADEMWYDNEFGGYKVNV